MPTGKSRAAIVSAAAARSAAGQRVAPRQGGVAQL